MGYTSLFRRSPTQQWIQQGNSKGWNAPFPLRSLGTDAHLTPGREAAQSSGQLGLYPSLSSWGHGLCLWSQGALSLSSLPASAWHYARFWWDVLSSILPCAAAGCRGVLAPVVVFYYCFVSKAAFHLHPVCTLPSILWKVNRRKNQIFSSPHLPSFPAGTWSLNPVLPPVPGLLSPLHLHLRDAHWLDICVTFEPLSASGL